MKLYWFAPIFSACLTLFTVANAATSPKDIRHFACPEFPLGKFILIETVQKESVYHPVKAAINGVDIIVPPGQQLMLELNPRCIEDPKKLSRMPTDGIDRIKLSYMSMDDDVHFCDNALKAIPLFHHPVALDCIRTDATDTGLLSFRSLNNLVALNCSSSGVRGNFLAGSVRLDKLRDLNLSHNGISTENLSVIKSLKSLSHLNLSHTGLRDDGLRQVCESKTIQDLDIDSNPQLTNDGFKFLAECPELKRLSFNRITKFSDNSLKWLQPLKKLKFLDLRDTSITEKGLEQLKDLHLQTILLPANFHTDEINRLRKVFRNTALESPDAEVKTDTQVLFAPLKQQ